MDFGLGVSEPPFEKAYNDLLIKHETMIPLNSTLHTALATALGSEDVPLVDIGALVGSNEEAIEKCKREIVEASKEWGFFQVVNHGIPSKILEEMSKAQMKMFKEPFEKKIKDDCLNMNLSPGSYRWGSPSATHAEQFSWSEAFQIPLSDLMSCNPGEIDGDTRSTVKQFATSVTELAMKLANILDENLGEERSSSIIKEMGVKNNSFLRLNKYAPCPKHAGMSGLVPHTDSDIVTILFQDQVGGLQILKDGNWIQVKPNPNALLVNIGDLFQALTNGVYKSVEHRVIANQDIERFSSAYFLNPTDDAVIESCKKPSLYRKFTVGEYKKQVQDDVLKFGTKVGLSRFLLSS